MTAVTRGEALGLPMGVGGEPQHLEQFTHFVFSDQALRLAALGQTGIGHGFGQAEVQQETGLAGVSQHIQAMVLPGQGDAREVHMGGDVLQAHGDQRVHVHNGTAHV